LKNLLIIDGPSAVGKTTIVNLLLEKNKNLEVAKRVTTRPKRESEEDLLSYDFIDLESFNRMITNGELIEFKHYLFGMSYGLPKKNVLDCFARDKHTIGIINLGNLVMVKKTFPHAFGVFLDTSLETIKRRLEARGIHTREQIEERLMNAQKGFAFKKDYDLVIKNEDRSAADVVDEILETFYTFNEKYKSFQ
jgi:guanylate kinase